MKILRVVNGVPVEFELTSHEAYETYVERHLDIIKDNLMYALEYESEADDPDTDDPMAASNILAALKRSPLLAEKVALKFDEFISDATTIGIEAEYAVDAYKHIIKSLEVCK